jgi:hypothetical protein
MRYFAKLIFLGSHVRTITNNLLRGYMGLHTGTNTQRMLELEHPLGMLGESQ